MSGSGLSGGVYEAGTVEAAKRHCFAILVDNEPGVLARVVGLFSGRGYNIESLTVDEVNHETHLSRITIVTKGTPKIIEQIKAQLGRLVAVRQTFNLSEQGAFVEGCLAFIKFIGNASKRAEASSIAAQFGARMADTTDDAVIFEMAATNDKIDQLIARLQPLGMIEEARTGSVAMGCGEKTLSQPKSERRTA